MLNEIKTSHHHFYIGHPNLFHWNTFQNFTLAKWKRDHDGR